MAVSVAVSGGGVTVSVNVVVSGVGTVVRLVPEVSVDVVVSESVSVIG